LIPPPARRPATLIVLLIIALTLLFAYFTPSLQAVSQIAPSALQYTPKTTVEKQDKGPISPDYNTHFASGHLPSAFDDPLYSTLSDRLVRFLNRPTYTHEEAKGYMTEHCPLELADGLVNPDQYKGSIDFWKNEVGREVILDKRAELAHWLERRIRNGEKVVWEEGMGDTKGIVMTGGNKVSCLQSF
jgi:hypothetical protein